MGEIRLHNAAASVGFGCDDVVRCLREVEPVLAAMVELEPEFGSPIVRKTVAKAGHEHVALPVHRRLERVRHQTAERCGGAGRPGGGEIAATVEVEGFCPLADVH